VVLKALPELFSWLKLIVTDVNAFYEDCWSNKIQIHVADLLDNNHHYRHVNNP